MAETNLNEPNAPLKPLNHKQQPVQTRSSRVGRLWVSLVIAVIILVLLLIFIAQNSKQVQVHFLGYKGTTSFGVALLAAAVAGAILVLLIGSARILQLKHERRSQTTNNDQL